MCDNGTKKDNLKTLNQNVSNSRLWLVWSNIRPKANYNYWLYQCVVITPSKKKKKKWEWERCLFQWSYFQSRTFSRLPTSVSMNCHSSLPALCDDLSASLLSYSRSGNWSWFCGYRHSALVRWRTGCRIRIAYTALSVITNLSALRYFTFDNIAVVGWLKSLSTLMQINLIVTALVQYMPPTPFRGISIFVSTSSKTSEW